MRKRYWTQLLGLLRKDYKFALGLFVFASFIIIALTADVLANPNSIVVPFGPETATQSSPIYKPPGFVENIGDEKSKIHLLGTDQLGRDVLARMIHGTNLALLVGLISTVISFLIALLLGSLSGYYGDDRLRVNWLDIVLGAVGFILGIAFLNYNSYSTNAEGQQVFEYVRVVVILIVLVLWIIGLKKLTPLILTRKSHFPIDTIIVKLLEVFRAIPALFLIIALFSLIEYPSIWTVIFIIGVLRWGTMTRLLRAEIMHLKTENYIVSARIMGLSDRRILISHIWPNAIGPVIVSACFYIGTAVLIEATLSFLGIGVPVNVVSWGNMLSASRSFIGAWWLALFPGLAIFLLILSVTIIGDRLRNHLKGGE